MTGKIFRCPLLLQEGETLLAQGHPQAGEVSQRLQVLQGHWEKLRQAVVLRGQDLEDMQNFLGFLQRVDLCEAWIQEMVRPQLGRAWGSPRPAAPTSLRGGAPAARRQGLGAPRLLLRVLPSQPPASTGGDSERR